MNCFKNGVCMIGKNSMLVLTAEECKMIASFFVGAVCGMIFNSF